jgi:peptidyl-prolyl cis-trans isomerase D
MLKMMRQSFRHLKWILWFVVIVFVAFIFVDWGMGRVRGDRSASGEVATVGGERITAVDFSRQYQQTQERYRQMYKDNWTPALAKALDLPNQVLNGMIERRMLIDAARRSGVRVSDAELSEKIQSLSALQRNGQFIGAREYSNLLAANGMTPDQFERDFRADMLIEKYNRLVAASLIVPDSEVESQFARQSEKAKIDYVLISPDHFEASAAPTEAELLAAFEKNKERYRQPERRKLKYLLVDETRLREKIRPTPAQLRAYYDAHPDDFPVSDRVHAAHILVKVDRNAKPDVDAAAKKKAEDLAARARKGEDFAKLAEKYSEDPGSKDRGGDLGPFARGAMVKVFEDTAFAMTPGQISDPVKSPFGYHVIKLIEKLPPGKQTFEEAAPKIVASLQQSAVKAEETRRSEALEKAVTRKSSDEDLRKLADDVVSFDATDWITAQSVVPGVGYAPGFTKAAFELKNGEVSPHAISTPRGPAIVKVADVKAPGIPDFAEVKSKVAADVKGERTQQKALDSARPIEAELQGGSTLEAVAKKFGASVQSSPEFAKGAPVPSLGNSAALSEEVFRTPVGKPGGPVWVGPQGVVLFRVASRNEFDPAAFERQKGTIRESIRQQEAQKLIQADLARRRAGEKIVVNDEVLGRYNAG